MAALTPFLVGGPAYSGTTLLTVLLDATEGVVCLDEPDFGKPEQVHRNIPLLRRRFPDLRFPDPPGRPLTPAEELRVVRECAEVLAPRAFGIKTCGPAFVALAELFRASGFRVAAVFRDPRDILVRDEPDPTLGTSGLLANCRVVWDARDRLDGWVRYEDLVGSPEATLRRVAELLGLDAAPAATWDPAQLTGAVFKTGRHDALGSGRIRTDRVGLWRHHDRPPSTDAHSLAWAMGYGS